MEIPNSKMEYFQKESSVCGYRPSMFQGYGCKYNDLVVKKPNCYNSNSVDNCTEYPSICITKPISNVISSGLSYIIGGFVGSKSQMNNVESHKFDLDLGAYIAEILATWEYQQELTSVKGSNKKLGNSSSKMNLEYSDKSASNASTEATEEKESLNNAVELLIAEPPDCDINNKKTILNSSNNCLEPEIKEEKRLSCILSNPYGCNRKENDGSNIVVECNQTNKCKIICEAQAQFQNQKPTLEYLKNLENIRSIPITNNNTYIEKGNEISTSLSSSSGCSDNSDSEHIISLDNCVARVFNKADMYLKNFGDFLAADRLHRASECSIDSTDSESFIIFDDCFDDNENNKFEKTCCKQENDDFNSKDDSDYEEYNEYNAINEYLGNNCDDYVSN